MLQHPLPNAFALRGACNNVAKSFGMRLTVVSVLAAFSPTPPVMAAPSVQLAQAESYSTVNIPSGPLANALNEYAQAVGVSVAFDAGVLEGLSTEGMHATVSTSEGFEQLLRGSGFKAARLDGNSYILEALPTNAAANIGPEGEAQTLGGVVVRGSGPVGSAPTDNYTVRESSSATGLDLSLKDTPQSITTFTAQQMQDQGLLTVSEVLEQTPGVTLITAGVGGAGSQPVYARSLPVKAITMDGMMATPALLSALPNNQITMQDSFLYERIDIIRGATSLQAGAGDPSASLNFVRKHPYYERHLQANLKYGSWNTKRGEFDFSTPLTENGRWRARLAAVYQKGDHWVDRVNSNRKVLSLITALDVTDNDTLSLGMTYYDFELNGASPHGITRYSQVEDKTKYLEESKELNQTAYAVPTDPTKRNFNSATPWSRAKRTYKNFFATWDHNFNDNWNARLSYNRADNEDDSLYGEIGTRYYVPSADRASYVADRRHSKNKVDALDLRIRAAFEVLGLEQQLMVGANYYDVNRIAYSGYAKEGGDDSLLIAGCVRQRNGRWGKAGEFFCERGFSDYSYGASGISISEWEANGGNRPPTRSQAHVSMDMFNPKWAYHNKTKYTGMYFATHLKPIERVGVIIGGRWAREKKKHTFEECFYTPVNTNNACGRYYTDKEERFQQKVDSGFLPYYGLTVELTDNINAYASYTTSYERQDTQKSYSPGWLPPYIWVSREVGAKGEFFNGSLNVAAAYFNMKKKNFAYQIVGKRQEGLMVGTRVKGYELTLAGMLTSNWMMSAGYVYQHQQVGKLGVLKSTMLDLTDFSDTYKAPRRSLKFFTNYSFPNGLVLGGGMRWQSATRTDWVPPTNERVVEEMMQESYAVVDLMAKYKFNKNLSLQLNVNNVFDKQYYQHEISYISGAPRNYLLSLSYKY